MAHERIFMLYEFVSIGMIRFHTISNLATEVSGTIFTQWI